MFCLEILIISLPFFLFQVLYLSCVLIEKIKAAILAEKEKVLAQKAAKAKAKAERKAGQKNE